MQNQRDLTKEELALLSAPVEKPTAQWDSYQETGELRPVREPVEPRRGGPFEALHAVGERLEAEQDSFLDPWEAEPWQIGSLSVPNLFATAWNLPGSVARATGELAATISPFHIGKELGRRAVIASFADKAAGDDDSLYRYYHDFLTEHTESQLTEQQETLVTLTKEVVGPFAKGTFANPYDPRNAALFDPSTTQERMPIMHALGEFVEGVLPATPWDQEYNPEWSENLSRLIQEESGELALEFGLGAALGGGGVVSGAVRRGTGAVRRGVRGTVSDFRLEGVFDFDDVDVFTGRDYGRQRQAGTVELDIARQEGFARTGAGGVVTDPETGRTYISTAAHVFLGKRGEPVDLQGIRARTGTGEIGTVQRVSAVDLERDIALLEVAGLSETLDIPDLPDPSAPHTLLGREGIRAESRVVGESGAYLETTTATGVAGESGAPIISGGADIAGAYLGTLDQPGRVERGMYAPVSAISQLFGQVGDRGVQLGHELSQRALREGLHHRIGRGDADAWIEGGTPRVPRDVEVPAEVAAPAILFPQFQLAGEDVELHSRDPETELTFHEGDWHRRYQRGISREHLPTLSPDDPLHEIYGSVGQHRGLFFRIGTRGEDISRLRTLDVEQTLAYEAWYGSERPPYENFAFMGGGQFIPNTFFDFYPERQDIDFHPEALVYPETLDHLPPVIESAGVMGITDITALGRYLKHRETLDTQLQVQLFGPQGARAVGIDPTSEVLQVISGRSPIAPMEGRDPSIHLPGHQFVYEPEVLLELGVPEVDELRRIYRDIGETDPARDLLWLPDPDVGYEHHIPPTLISASVYQRTPDPDGGLARLSLARHYEGRTRTESVLVHRAGQKPTSEMPPIEEWTIGELSRAAQTKSGRYKQEAIVEIERRGGADRDPLTARSRQYRMPPIEEWTNLELQREVAQSLDLSGDAYDEIFRRRMEDAIDSVQRSVTAPAGQAIPTEGTNLFRALQSELKREYHLGRPRADYAASEEIVSSVGQSGREDYRYDSWEERTERLAEESEGESALGDLRAEDIEFEHEVEHRRATADVTDHTLKFVPQDYKEEAWEPAKDTIDPDADQTGLVYEGWTDEYGDFDQVEKDKIVDEQTVLIDSDAGTEPVATEYIEEFGVLDPGIEERVVGSDISETYVDSGKVSGSVYGTGSEQGLSPTALAQLTDMFSGLIESSELQRRAKERDPALKKEILAEIESRDPDWYFHRSSALYRVSDLLQPDSRPFFEQQISMQAEGWRETADLLWSEGRYSEFSDHIRPVTKATWDVILEQDYSVPREPRWKRERREALAEIPTLYENIQEIHRLAGERAEGIMFGDQRRIDFTPLPDPTEEFWKSEAQRLALPKRDYFAEFRMEVYEEEYQAGVLRERRKWGWEDQEDDSHLKVDALRWHQRNVVEEQLHLKTLAGVEAVGPEAWSHLSRELPAKLSPEQERIAQQRSTEMQQLAEAESEARQTAQAGAFRMATDPAFASVRRSLALEQWKKNRPSRAGRVRDEERRRGSRKEAILEELKAATGSVEVELRDELKELERPWKTRFDRELKAADEQAEELFLERFDERDKAKYTAEAHSLLLEDVHPLDLNTPRGRLAGFLGIESDRTYGLELEIITDLTRADMEAELERQIERGLILKYDLSLQTTEPDFALEHHDQYGDVVSRTEAADYERYLAQYTDAPGYEQVRPDDFETLYGHELVFPVMRGEEGIELIDETFEKLQRFGTEFNTSMGMHIHVGAGDLSNYDLVGVWGAFTARESVIDLMHEPSRRGEGTNYARSMFSSLARSEITVGELLRAEVRQGDPSYVQLSDQERARLRLGVARKASLLSGATRETFLDQVGYGDRYQKLNLRSQYRTVEYRQPAPTLDVSEVEGHIGFITSFVDEFAGKPLEWVFEKDPRLQQEHAGLDLVFESPSQPGQLLLDIEQHSLDPEYREGYEIPGLERFLEAADRHSGIFYRFESDDSSYVSQDLAQTHAILREHEGQENLLPDSFMVPGMGKYDTLIRPAGRDQWSLYNEQHEQIRRGEKEGTWELWAEDYDPETDDFEFVHAGPVDVGYVGRRGLYGHVDRSSFVEVSPEVLGFRASETPLQLSDTERHFSVHFGTSTPYQQYVGAMSPGEDVFLSHGVLARLPVNLDALGSIAQQRYAVNPKYDEFIETGNINLNLLADAIGELPEGASPDRIWGDYLSARQGSDILGLQRAVQQAREGLIRKSGYRIGGFEFDVQESPFPGFNPWLDPHPEGTVVSEKRRSGRRRESRRDRRHRLLGSRSERETPLVQIPQLPDPVETARNVPGSFGRMVGSLYNLVRPPDIGGNIVDWVTGEDKASWFTEEQRGFGNVVWDFARLWSEDRRYYHDRSEYRQKFPHLAAASEGFLESTPFGPEGWSGFISHLEQEPAEWLMDVGLAATGAGVGVSGLRRATRLVPDTPMQRFARQWTEVDPATVPYSPGRWVGGDGPPADYFDLDSDIEFLPDIPEGMEKVRDLPRRPNQRLQTDPYNYDLEGVYSAPRLPEATAFEELQSSRPRWEQELATEAQLKALRSQYPDRDYTGITKKEASNILSFDFYERIYEGEPVDYHRAATLGVDLPDPSSAVAAQQWAAPEYVPAPDILELGRRQAEAAERMVGYEPIYNMLHRGPDVPERGSAQFSIYGQPNPPEVFGPHPSYSTVSDYHSGEITSNKFDLGAKEIAIGSGISLTVGGGIYGWQRYFGGEPAYQRPEIVPHFTEDERVEQMRVIEGGGMASEKQITALTRIYPDRDLSNLTKAEASELFDAYVPSPKMATEAQKKSLARMYPDKDLSNLTRDEASKLFDDYKPPPKMATEGQITALTRMYPDKDLTGLTKTEASALFESYKKPQRSNEATQGQLDYLKQLRGGGSDDVMPIEQVDESDGLTRQEVSALIDYEKAKRRSADISREAAGPAMASESQLRYLGQLNPQRYGGLSATSEDVMGIEDVSFDDGITAAEARTLFDYEDAVRKSRQSAGPAMASEAQMMALRRIYPEQLGQQTEEQPMMGIEEITFDDGITRREAAALFDYQAAREKSAGPPMASEGQIAALQRFFPKMFENVEIEEEPLLPLEQIEFVDPETGKLHVTREEARQAFRHVKEIPPPMATPRQVDRLEREFPHAFKQVGRAEQYLQTGRSYGIVKSLEDIYDADTFTGMLFDAPSGQVFKEDTVRLGDFNAPEIKPDPMKPREYQEREAARARQSRDVFRSLVERFNVGRDVEQEGYVIPIEFRQDPNMLGGLERGFYGRVLGDVNFEGVDYEQFMIQQGMGSVYGASIEWGAEEINPLDLWRRTPTYLDQLGKGTEDLLWQIPETIVGGILQGGDPVDAVTGTFKQVPGALKDMAIKGAKQTAIRATKDFFKERFTDDFTPNNLSFAQRYIGDLGGVGQKVGAVKDTAAGFLQSGWGAAIAPAAIAAGTAILGERSLDTNYAEVVPAAEKRKEAFGEMFRLQQEIESGYGPASVEMGSFKKIVKEAVREVLSESGLSSISDVSTRISRKLRESDSRGVTRGRS